MKFGLGFLRLPPREFWSMTLPEFMMALEGFAESRGAKSAVTPLTKDEVDELFAGLDENGALIIPQDPPP